MNGHASRARAHRPTVRAYVRAYVRRPGRNSLHVQCLVVSSSNRVLVQTEKACGLFGATRKNTSTHGHFTDTYGVMNNNQWKLHKIVNGDFKVFQLISCYELFLGIELLRGKRPYTH